jgi:hypothetical protein
MAASDFLRVLRRGVVLPAHPLALDARRRLDERRQRGLSRYYVAAGAGGLAVGVHTTQFEIRDPAVGLLRPVWELAREEMDRADKARHEPLVRIAGICGQTSQALGEARLARDLGYHIGLLSLTALKTADDNALLSHCRAVCEVLPVMGFYLQPAVGGRVLGASFWRQLMEIPGVVAIKIAPFNRYQTIDVVRSVAASGREDVVLYTGNDDSIVIDLLTPFYFRNPSGESVCRRIVGGLLGHWAVWTHVAVKLLEDCRSLAESGRDIPAAMLHRSVEITDGNAAIFDAAHGFAGCRPGIHEVLRRQGLLEGRWCLNPHEELSPGQMEQIDRVCACYPHLTDDTFVAEHRDEWLRG